MSIFRKPKGQYVRGTGDWFFERAMGGATTQTPIAGRFSTCSLYNDAIDGSILHVIALNVWVPAATSQATINIANGVFGTLAVGAANKVAPFGPQLAGSLYDSTELAAPGMAIHHLGGGGVPDHWPHEFPLCMLGPGQSLIVVHDTVNLIIHSAFIWLVMPYL